MDFLGDFDLRPVQLKETRGFAARGLILGQGKVPVEVLILEAPSRPTTTDLRTVWKARLAGRAVPLLVVVLHGTKAAVCGPGGEEPPTFPEIDRGRLERICRTALGEPDRHAALRFLHSAIPSAEVALAGLRNEGLFATHELEYGVPRRGDWNPAGGRARSILDRRGKELLEALGYTIEALPGPASILRSTNTKVAIAVLLDRQESPDVASTRFSQLSPASYALAKADEENLPFVLLTTGSAIRLYSSRTGVGVARRGRTETFVELHLDLIEDDKAAFLWLLFSAGALSAGGTFEDILSRSSDYAADLGVRLRDRVYEKVIPRLSEALLDAQKLRNPTAEKLATTYEMALTILFRLLFVAYAEDKDLLPYRTNDLYRARSLKQKAKELAQVLKSQGEFDRNAPHWDDIKRLFAAVNAGNREWGVPAYDGGLFESDADVSPVGARLEKVSLPGDVIGPILAELLVDESPEGRGPVDFRSLGVSEFGTIYEGLLENELGVAEVDLAVGKDGAYRPAKKKDAVVVAAGSAYLQNSSGSRKSSGSYFTKAFAVDHLLDHALEPALADHLVRLDALTNDRDAAAQFFDFRVADVAMGSGHFLVAAVDRIERALSSYLARRPLPDVLSELNRLRGNAREALGVLADGFDIEDTQLLRRQIARRCIFGVDLNPLSVQLSRLSIWIHTFVPGLPLSFLDHNLVHGNSLVGFATVQEVEEFLREVVGGLFQLSADGLVGGARKEMDRLARLSDASAAEIKAARQGFAAARKAIKPAEALFDILAAARFDNSLGVEAHGAASHWVDDLGGLPDGREYRKARKLLGPLNPIHFPIVFPEVFLRKRAGFDVILGNPPWEEATVEEDRFWTRYQPGLHSLPQHEQEAAKKKLRRDRPELVARYEEEVERAAVFRNVLTTGPFPGMGTGDPDLYKAFAWRFVHLAARDGGRIGVVLPRSAFAAKGSTEFRKEILQQADFADLTFLLNRMGWVFEDAHPQYTIALASIGRSDSKGLADRPHVLPLRGPFASRGAFDVGVQREPSRFSVVDVLSWSETASLPLLPSDESADVFLQLRRSPRLDATGDWGWFTRPNRELDATNDKALMKFAAEQPDGFWPVYKGESFDIWEPDTGTYYAWANPDKMLKALHDKRSRARSSFDGFATRWMSDPETLPCLAPRIAFRDVTNRTNSRTVVSALLPPKVFATNKAPYFLWPRGDEKDQAYLLGILSSIPLDWYARRFVEISLNYFILNPFPVPRPPRSDKRWQRVVDLAGRLASPDRRFAKWAKAVGVETGKLGPDEKEDMIHELDAVVAHLYGLSEPQLRHIFETFHEGWEFGPRLEATVAHFRAWEGRK